MPRRFMRDLRRFSFLPRSLKQAIMTAKIRGLVSKKKIRYQKNGFDLDLSYILDTIIAMGFPAEKFEGVYRNHIDEVRRFLEFQHKDHYKIYNLCCERQYDISKFKNVVAHYPFEDHNPPPMELIEAFCKDVESWLAKDTRNVAVVHCKAGKGRTGVMICSYMLHVKASATASEALSFYGEKRTHDKKGVTIPSQIRYVEYYEELVRNNLQYKPATLFLRSLHLNSVPNYNGGPCTPFFRVSQGKNTIYTSPTLESKKSTKFLQFDFPEPLMLCGDIRVEFFNKPKMMKKERIFQFWFNTFFAQKRFQNQEGHNWTRVSSICCGSMNGTISDTTTTTTTTTTTNPSFTKDCACGIHKNSFPNNSICSNRVTENCDEPYTLSFTKDKLDKASKDITHKHCSPDFKIKLTFAKINGLQPPLPQVSNSPQIDEESTRILNSVDGVASHYNEFHDDECDETDTETEEEYEYEGCCETSHV